MYGMISPRDYKILDIAMAERVTYIHKLHTHDGQTPCIAILQVSLPANLQDPMFLERLHLCLVHSPSNYPLTLLNLNRRLATILSFQLSNLNDSDYLSDQS